MLDPDSLQLLRRAAGQALPSLWALRLCEPPEIFTGFAERDRLLRAVLTSGQGSPPCQDAAALGVRACMKAGLEEWHQGWTSTGVPQLKPQPGPGLPQHLPFPPRLPSVLTARAVPTGLIPYKAWCCGALL